MKQLFTLAAILMTLLTVIGCAATKLHSENKREHSKTSSEFSSDISRTVENSSNKSIIRDSLQENIVVEIFPTGIFSYSPSKGFTGMASAIKVKGVKTKGTTIEAESNSSAVSLHSQQHLTETKTRSSVQQTDKIKFNINFWIYVLGAISIGGVWVCWKRKWLG